VCSREAKTYAYPQQYFRSKRGDGVVKSDMYREIHEQPEVLAAILEEEWGKVVGAARTLRGRGFRFAMLVARGTSDNAALYAKYLFEIRLGVPASLAAPSAFTLYESEMNLEDVLVIGISQSGESKDVLEVLRRSRQLGAITLSLTNDENSSLASAADVHLWLRAGDEKSVAASKTYTAELLLLYLLMAALEESSEPDVERLPDKAKRVLDVAWEGVERYRYANYMTVASRGYNFATAREAALKLMETTYTVTEAFSEADLRHGPMAMIGRGFPVVLIVPPGKAYQSMVSLAKGLTSRGAELVVIGEDRDLVGEAAAGFLVPVSCPEELSPILYALPAQLLAHRVAELRGLDPDSPRGLSKVTETW
jgi:glucosamine--fructose-6-phosphate aminotransferase (isomerizing)